jgi:hypothetical protein
MKLTSLGTDLIRVNETNINQKYEAKVHLIKFDFAEPNREKINKVLENFPNTNRFVISNTIKLYNDILRETNKKYYVMNNKGDKLITFFKKNNKVLLDTTKLTELERLFVLNVDLKDVLFNTEVMLVTKEDYKEHVRVFTEWRGDLILFDPKYLI